MSTAPPADSWRSRAAILLGFVGLMWVVHFVRAVFGLAPGFFQGIVPRDTSSLVNIITAPFIHANLEHLVANSIPLLILGAVVLLRGAREFFVVVQIVILIAGLGTWLFGAPGSMHIGASGIVFGFITFLVFRGIFERSFFSIAVSVFVAALYGSAMGVAMIPERGISWSGHIFGMVAGIIAARFLAKRREKQVARETPLVLAPPTDKPVDAWIEHLEEETRKKS
jgi:membrane associated rhomboid family serine protease